MTQDPCLDTQAQWYAGKHGSFVLSCALQLTRHMLSPWPRRGHSLLEIHCTQWKTLETFWESAFDVTAVVDSLEQAQTIHEHLLGKVDVHQGAFDQLPFEDNSFDYVAYLAPPSMVQPPLYAIIREAVRLSAKGVLLQFWNPFSFAGMQRAWWASKLPSCVQNALWLPWRDALGLLRTASPKAAISTRTTLFGPAGTWHATSRWSTLQKIFLPFPIGALAQIRLTHASALPLTGIPLGLPSLRLKPATPVTQTEYSCKPATQTVNSRKLLQNSNSSNVEQIAGMRT